MTAIKKAVEHYKGVWPDNCRVIVVTEKGEFILLLSGIFYSFGGKVKQIYKQQFEDYVKEQQMQEVKYKYVDAGINTVGELYDRIDTDDNGCFIGEERLCIIVDSCSISFESKLEPLSLVEIKQLIEGEITTRQTLPWYEVDGVFDSPKLCSCLGEDIPVFMFGYDDRGWLKDGLGNSYKVEDCTPLAPEETAKYGVECGE